MKYHISRELHCLNARIGREFETTHRLPSSKEITGANSRIIHYLAEHQNDILYQKDLEKAFGITRSTASRVLGLMEEKGLIERTSVHHDARLKRVTLTERALDISQSMGAAFDDMDEKLFADFTEGEKQQMMQFLERMQRNLE